MQRRVTPNPAPFLTIGTKSWTSTSVATTLSFRFTFARVHWGVGCASEPRRIRRVENASGHGRKWSRPQQWGLPGHSFHWESRDRSCGGSEQRQRRRQRRDVSQHDWQLKCLKLNRENKIINTTKLRKRQKLQNSRRSEWRSKSEEERREIWLWLCLEVLKWVNWWTFWLWSKYMWRMVSLGKTWKNIVWRVFGKIDFSRWKNYFFKTTCNYVRKVLKKRLAARVGLVVNTKKTT